MLRTGVSVGIVEFSSGQIVAMASRRSVWYGRKLAEDHPLLNKVDV